MRVLLAVMVLVLVVAPVWAEEGDPINANAKPVEKPFELSAIWENDGAIRPGGPDRYYTNGMLLSLAHQPQVATDLFEAVGLPVDAAAVGYHVGHQMFTPGSLDINPPDPTDRPYAGYIFAGIFVQREADKSLDHFQFDLGYVGPSVQAGGLQRWAHDTFAGVEPLGWGSQLNDEVTYQSPTARSGSWIWMR